MDKEMKKREAVKRLAMLGLEESILSNFADKGEVYYSVPAQIGGLKAGILYRLDSDSRFQSLVKQTEEKKNILVFHVIYQNTLFGEMLTMLYVSDTEEEWESENEEYENGKRENDWYVCAYVYNLTTPEFSQFGYVGFKEAYGGLVKTA